MLHCVTKINSLLLLPHDLTGCFKLFTYPFSDHLVLKMKYLKYTNKVK